MARGSQTTRRALERATFLVTTDDEAAKGRGTAILIGARRALTCAHVVVGLDRVVLREGPGKPKIATATVGPRGDSEGADDLAVLELDAPLADRVPLRFEHDRGGMSFRVAGHPGGGVRDFVDGTVLGEESELGWLQLDAKSGRVIDFGFSGAAVWDDERDCAVGLVVAKEADRVAYAIPTSMIRAFAPELFAPDPAAEGLEGGAPAVGRSTSRRRPDFGTERLVQILFAGKRRGPLNGFRLTADWILTGAEAAIPDGDTGAAGPELSVVQRERGNVTRIPARAVWPSHDIGNDSASAGPPANGVALVQARASPDRFPSFDRFLAEEPEPGRLWHCWRGGRVDQVPGPKELAGSLATLDEGVWTLTVDGDALDLAQWQAFVGAPVFVALAGNDFQGMRLLGVFDRRTRDGSAEAVAWTLDRLRGWSGFETGVRDGSRHSISRHIDDTARLLRDHARVVPEIVRRDRTGLWAAVGDRPDQLAERMCAESDPVNLAIALVDTYCALADRARWSDAEAVHRILLWSLPAALATAAPGFVPDPSAVDVRFRLPYDVLIDFLIAACERRSAGFHEPIGGSGSVLPTSAFELASPGELGPDPDGVETAAGLVRDVYARLALPAGLDPASERRAKRLLAQVSAETVGASAHYRLFDDADRELLELLPNDSRAAEMLRIIDRRLADGLGDGTGLFLRLGGGESALAKALRGMLPSLRQVHFEQGYIPGSPEHEMLLRLVDALRRSFAKRMDHVRNSE